ncbi:AT-rich interactive domain-containing protein 4B [Lucilia sericata]|uniref:AT-rich interactive domain-containing protein 4B n=1 Tax=Lucilia sericata TaxID=13632 RepID=UPI0018A85708|nr:AT-rich interactive domain-containing protein 4B [Lucilia sericata]
MESMDHRELKKSTRRSKKVKNLEEEVELIFSQDESDEDVKENLEEILPKTPSRRDGRKNTATTPKATSQTVLQENLQTPRRSCRKSIRPTQEYDDIVNKSLRSCTRSAKKHLLVTEEEEEVEEKMENKDEIIQPKWTPAKVGRVSQKRSRKSRRNDKGKKTAKGIEEQDKEEIGEFKNVMKEIKDQEEENPKCGKDEEEVKVSEFVLVEDRKEEQEEVKANENIEEKLTAKKTVEQNNGTTCKGEEEEIKNMEVEESKSEKYLGEVKVSEFVLVEDTKEENEQIQTNKDLEEKQTEEIVETQMAQINSEIDNDLENHEDSIQLVQDDSEDCKEFEQKTEDEICIVFENNISNCEIKEQMEDKEKDSFGCYLKQKQINISDLGLNLLKDEEEEREITDIDDQTKPTEEVEDMPSLIMCDDEDDIGEYGGKSNIKLNETFEATGATEETGIDIKNAESNESEKEIEKFIESSENPNDEIMETLQMSDDDDGETPRKPPRVQKHTPQPQKTILYALKDSAVKINPKDIVLRGIRKRSLSVCINGNEEKSQKLLAGPLAKAKQDRMVSFYSPANQQTIIEDLDKMIAKSLKKQKSQENKGISSKFVTTRRKRSISLDESTMSASFISKLPRPVVNQNLSGKTQTSTSKPLSRTKLPNFAAIHEKQFKKMENLVDHVSRKQERSKNLINSATKLRPVSAQKNISIIKNSQNVTNEKPKALKKIDLGSNNNIQIKKSQFNNTTTTDLNRTQDVLPVINLPDPRLANNSKLIKSGTISRRPPQQQPIRNYLKPSQTTNIEKSNTKAGPTKPTFNLSTSLMAKPTFSSSLAEKPKVATTKSTFNLSTSLMVKPATSSTSFAEKANTSHMSNEDKMASRLQRHMDLFKGRVPSTRAGVASRRNETILKGVRSNRRFELQMQHRKNLD